MHPLIQTLELRAQVQQGNMTHTQALDRFTMMQTSSVDSFKDGSAPQQWPPGFNAGEMPSGNAHQQLDTLMQHAQVSINDQINPLRRTTQTQDAAHFRHFNLFTCQGSQLQNDSGLTSRMPSNSNLFRMDPSRDSQEPGSIQENFPPVFYANFPSSSATSVTQPPPGPYLVNSIHDLPLSRLRALSTHLVHILMDVEKNIRGSSEGDVQRQLRAEREHIKRRLRALQEVINAKVRAR